MSVEIHPTAIVAKGAELAEGVSIGPYSIIGEHAKIGARTQILAHVIVEVGIPGSARTARSATSPTWAGRRITPATMASRLSW